MTESLPQFLRETLNAPPRAGEGVHNWLFRVARQLHAHLPVSEIVNLLETSVQYCGRDVPHSEIVSAVENSQHCAWQPSKKIGAKRPAKWPEVDGVRRQEIVSEGLGLADLWELSPIRIDHDRRYTEEIVDALFPGNPLLCCGKASDIFDTRPREEWRGKLSGLQLIVPSSMTATHGTTKKDGRKSKHTLDNTGSRRFLIVEFDSGAVDEQASLLRHLAGYAPLVCAVHSGGKSLHGWFFVSGQPEEKVQKFFRYAVSLGGDRATWTRSQFVRMPDGTRNDGKRQTVHFLSLKPLEATR